MIEILVTSVIWALIVLAMLRQQHLERQAHRAECRELANRIQHPEIVPMIPQKIEQDILTEDDAEWAKVGTIELD